MTLDEAKKYWEWKYNRTKDYSDTHWEADERHEHQEYVEALHIVVKALEENSKLKRLLKLAVEDMKDSQSVCEFCKHLEKGRHGSTEMPCYLCDRTSNKFEWRYADEAKGLIENDCE